MQLLSMLWVRSLWIYMSAIKKYMIEDLKNVFDCVLANSSHRAFECEGHKKNMMLTAGRKRLILVAPSAGAGRCCFYGSVCMEQLAQ